MSVASVSSPAGGVRFASMRNKFTVAAITVVLAAGFSIVEPRFYSMSNIENLFRQTSFLLILTLAQMFPIITRGFDLSTGNLLSVVSVVTALAMNNATGWTDNVSAVILFGIFAGLAAGMIVGVFNGLCIAYGRISNFVVTVGMMSVCVGIASSISNGFPVLGLPDRFAEWFATGNWFGIPPPVVLAALLAIGAHILLRYTLFGRTLYILGSNRIAAYVAGLPDRRVHFLAYLLCSVGTAIVAILLTARTGSGEPMLGSSQLTLQSIVAAVVGGVSLNGGRGGVFECVIGALFMTTLSIGMNLIRIETNTQLLVLGVIILAAILIDRQRTATY